MRRSFRVFVFEKLGRWNSIDFTTNFFADEISSQYQAYEAYDTEKLQGTGECQTLQVHRRLSRETDGGAQGHQAVDLPRSVGPRQSFRLEGGYHPHSHSHHHGNNKTDCQGMSSGSRKRGVSESGGAR